MDVGGHRGRERGRAGSDAVVAGHPVASCPDLRAHLRAAARAERLGHQVDRLQKQVLGRTESLARQFDRVLRVLEEWGYVRGWSLTPAGTRLARVYHEQDLLVAECAERSLLDGLRPPEMAAMVSVFTYEARGAVGGRRPGPEAAQSAGGGALAPCKRLPTN